MAKYLLRRLGSTLITLALIITAGFLLVELIPGRPGTEPGRPGRIRADAGSDPPGLRVRPAVPDPVHHHLHPSRPVAIWDSASPAASR